MFGVMGGWCTRAVGQGILLIKGPCCRIAVMSLLLGSLEPLYMVEAESNS